MVKIYCIYDELPPVSSYESVDSILITVREPFKEDQYYKEFDNNYLVIFNINIVEPSPAAICIGNNCLDIFFDSQEILININKENIRLSTISGSILSSEWIVISDSLRNYKSQLLDRYADKFLDGEKMDMKKLIKMHSNMDSSDICFTKKIIEQNINILGWTLLIKNIEYLTTEYLNIWLDKFKQFSKLPSYKRAILFLKNRK